MKRNSFSLEFILVLSFLLLLDQHSQRPRRTTRRATQLLPLMPTMCANRWPWRKDFYRKFLIAERCSIFCRLQRRIWVKPAKRCDC